MAVFSLWDESDLTEVNKKSSGASISLEEEIKRLDTFKFKDTWRFREAAICFEKNGYYTDALENTRSFYDFWDKEEEKIINGVTIDGVYISGMYYFFLNYCPIELVVETESKDAKGKPVTFSERITNFPKFWDLHWKLTTCIHIARVGMTLEDYKNLPLDLHLLEDEDNLKGGHHFLYLAGRGVGKCLAPETKVMLYNGGFILAKDIKIGDILMGTNSQPRVVLKTHSGYDEMYEINQNKGMSYTVNSEHLISLKRNKSKYSGQEFRESKVGDIVNIPVKELITKNKNFFESFSGFREPVNYSYKNIELDPYVLGVWLGDGTRSVPKFTISDNEIIEYLEYWAVKNEIILSKYYKGGSYSIGTSGKVHGRKNYFNLQLEKLNLYNNKHIPDNYLYTSKEIRLQILAGILDTDGYLFNGTFEIAQKSESLAKDIKILANGLGFRCAIRKAKKKIKSINFEGDYYILSISGDIDTIPNKVLRKEAILNKNKNKMISGIKNIIPKGVGQYYGFEVDGDNLFLLEDGTVTHNSFLEACIAAHRYFYTRKAASFLIAGDKAYLTGDGVFTKFTQYVTHINTNTPFKQFNDVKNDFNNMHLRASYRDNFGNEKGRKSEVIGVTIGDGKVNKLRGKRGYFIIEEIGSLPCASELWKTLRPGTEQGKSVYGQIIGFGTGGDISGGAEFMEKAFYQPEPFNILQFENIYDNGLAGTSCACFYPATYNVDFIDEDGNTDQKRSLEYILDKRKKAGKSKDSADLLGVKSEEPLTPSEALLRVDNTLFPKADLLQWKQEIIANNLHNYMVVNGFFVEKSNSIEFVPDPEAIPINKYPHDKRLPLGGCVSIFETPQYEGNKIPNNLYSVVVDPYMHEAGTSLGAIYVVKNINNFSKPDDCIVACYVGRPESMEAFHKLCYYFSRYYNAKIGIENNAGQTLVTWFKTNRLLNHLAPEFELSFNEAIPKSSVRRGFGMHIDKRKKEIGLAYLAEWLTQKYYITEDGEQLYNYHKIYDLGLLDEFINFNPDGNFDRISALIIAMYYMKEVEYKYQQNFTTTNSSISAYFNANLYQ